MSKQRTALVLGMLILTLVGCQSGTETQPSETESASGASKGESKGTGKEAARQAPRQEKVIAPAGTVLEVRLTNGIDSGKVSEGDNFEGTLASALVVHGVNVAPVGSTITGQVSHVVSSGRLNRPAELSLALTSLTAKGGEKVAISTEPWAAKGESHKKRDIEMIGGGAAAGALIGALTGGKKGAAIGGAAGAGGGTAVAAATGKKEIVLAPETKLEFKLSASATFSVRR